ncbi:MAG: hypothetical protein DPW11_00660 [bacterium]|nr:alpha/beta fold hydrolase [Candidatus Microgenomates bacterium CPR3]MCQ3944279.1 hypothetical protein [bacterium]RIK52043.1 MAG: hypothetical protein DCC61_00535 [Candidatus Microgenomates bacterium]
MKRGVRLILLLALIGVGTWFYLGNQNERVVSPQGEATVAEKPYEKYSFERLVAREDKASQIEIGREITKTDEYSSYVFYYQSERRRISGQLNLPTGLHPVGVIVMARGYVEKDGYTTGTGTRNAAAIYAKNGYITIAPDFSGYGESDQEDENALGARLVKPVEILDLIASLSSLSQVDLNKVYLWGHSNGGQIMLSVAEVLGKRKSVNPYSRESVLGATLWAPVSKPFPYNILFYTDEAEDQGKWLRSEIAKFEAEYDVFKYSIDKYLDWIEMPLVIHQGTVDDAVPVTWNRELGERLKEQDKSYTYYEYPGADHNMRPQWNMVVSRDLGWFESL